MIRNINDFLFTHPSRKIAVLATALVVSQAISVPAARTVSLSLYLLVSLMAFVVASVVFEKAWRVAWAAQTQSLPLRARRHSLDRPSVDVLGTSFDVWPDAAITGFISNRRILVTGAADEMVAPILRDLLKHRPAALYLLDSDSIRVEAHCRFVRRIAPNLICMSSIGELRDHAWLSDKFAEFEPDLVLDLNVYRFLQTHSRELDRENYGAYATDSRELYSRFQTVEAVLRAATATLSVQAVLMALPKKAREFVVENWLILQRNLLEGHVTGLGAHVTAENAVVSVWKPGRKSA